MSNKKKYKLKVPCRNILQDMICPTCLLSRASRRLSLSSRACPSGSRDSPPRVYIPRSIVGRFGTQSKERRFALALFDSSLACKPLRLTRRSTIDLSFSTFAAAARSRRTYRTDLRLRSHSLFFRIYLLCPLRFRVYTPSTELS